MPADLSSAIHGLAGRSGVLDDTMEFLAQYAIYAAALVFLALWFHRQGLRSGLAAAIGAIAALAVGALIGAVWNEQRPFVSEHFAPLISHGADASFPSDHLLALGAVAGATWVCQRPLALATAALAVAVGFARVFVGVHFVADVLGGFAIGAACGLLAWLALGPAQHLIDDIDAELQRRRLRPGRPQVGPGAAE